jgi:shikimate kinase
MSRAWILVGMMGAGKSSVGRSLAELSNREFQDTDQLIQNRFGRPVSQIFQLYGEETFRAHETSVLTSLEPSTLVLATGGGIVMREENWTQLRRIGITCFLRASLDVLCERLELSKKKRPLLEVDNWQHRIQELLEHRLPLYEKADFVLDVTSHDVDATAELALRSFQALEANCR